MSAFGHPDRDWPDDFVHENGNYVCRCSDCKKEFVGHKRRVVCRSCALRTPAIEVAEKAMAVQARKTERRYVRAMAEEYTRQPLRQRQWSGAFDPVVEACSYGRTSVEFRRKTIHQYGHTLHNYISTPIMFPLAGRHVRQLRIALFGEILLLKRQLEARDALKESASAASQHVESWPKWEQEAMRREVGIKEPDDA